MTKKTFGIRITLPDGDFLRSPHLLGNDWAGYRWFVSAQERDHAYQQMLQRPPFYRRDESPTQVLDKVERED